MIDEKGFFEEVKEEVRQDKIYALWKKYRKIVFIVVGTAALGFSGFYGWSWYRESQVNAMAEKYFALVKKQSAAEIIASKEEIENVAGSQYGTLATLLKANSYLQESDFENASKLFSKVAKDGDVPIFLRDPALLQAMQTSMIGASTSVDGDKFIGNKPMNSDLKALAKEVGSAQRALSYHVLEVYANSLILEKSEEEAYKVFQQIIKAKELKKVDSQDAAFESLYSLLERAKTMARALDVGGKYSSK